jgi:hypothetical protein
MKMGSEKRALDKIYKRRDRYEIPEWQRAEVWSDDRKQLLIDTIRRVPGRAGARARRSWQLAGRP